MSASFPDLKFVPQTHLVLLPGRERWLHTCHENPIDCDFCLQSVAQFLARELEYELPRALNKPTESYQAELGADVCTLDRARDLRRMTCQECLPEPRKIRDGWGRPVGLSFRERNELVLADEDLQPRAQIVCEQVCVGPTRWEQVKRFLIGCLVWPLLAAVGGVYFAGVLAVSFLAVFCSPEDVGE